MSDKTLDKGNSTTSDHDNNQEDPSSPEAQAEQKRLDDDILEQTRIGSRTTHEQNYLLSDSGDTIQEELADYQSNELIEHTEFISNGDTHNSNSYQLQNELDSTSDHQKGNPAIDHNAPIYYVGIGASAGGLEALQELFDNMPAFTGASFIVVQHLSPDFKSMMQQLLSTNTSMPVITVKDGVKVERDRVYLIPPRKNMILADGRLLLSDQLPDSTIKTPINILLRSMAEDQQHKAIGIILSGTGSDGSKGIKAIKEANGLVICQSPESAKFDGMPQNAMATGVVDLVLTPSEVANRIAALCEKPQLLQSALANTSQQNHERVMRDIFNGLKAECGIDFTQYKHSTVARRIERRMQVNQIESLDDYRDLLKESSKELKILAKELLIGVTRFFRDSEVFNYLEQHGLNQLLDNRAPNEPLRIWVAGCSTGEEAYSIAALVDSVLTGRQDHRMVKIFATDVDEEAIIRAGNGHFPADLVQDVPQGFLERYFRLNHDGSYTASKRLRQMIIFARHNMITDPPFSNIDLVSCRNTLIYFQYSAQRRVLSSFHFALKKHGMLLLGASESLGELQPHFDVINERYKLFIKNNSSQLTIVGQLPERNPNGLRSSPMKPIDWALKSHRAIDRSTPFSYVKDRLIEKFIPAAFILNERFEILHSYGASESYLRPPPKGQLNITLPNMVLEPLKIPISTALHRSHVDKCEVHYSDIILEKSDHTTTAIDMHIEYHIEHELNSAQPFYSIVITPTRFNEAITVDGEHSDEHGKRINLDISELARQRIQDLEEALAHNQEHLLVTVEELETTNEELQSTNEELMSANEELQSTNEELQSVNEELYTVNTEYQQKIHELTEVNEDLKNVLSASNYGVLFLDSAMHLRKFTQASTQFFNLISNDIGRPIEQISNNMDYPNLIEDIRRAQLEGQIIDKEVDCTNSQTDEMVSVRIVPYNANDHQGWPDSNERLLLVMTVPKTEA